MAAEYVSDGTVSWIGGMDSSRSPIDVAEMQYSRACNVMIPRSLGGIKVRHGIHCQYLQFDDNRTRELYEKGHVQAEGYYTEKSRYYLIVVVNGVALRFTRMSSASFFVESLNYNDPNQNADKHWVLQVPHGCIVTNGVDLPLYITQLFVRRTIPANNEMDVARMGVYVQNRLFYSNASGTIIVASDFLNPIGTSEIATSGIPGFQPPEPFDTVTAVGRQKVMLDYAEGGALVFSTRRNIYSVDVRSGRSTWADTGSSVGKVTQTVEGLSATSAYSFESFGTNLYFRSNQFGIADLRQSQYQFNNMDGAIGQSIEVSYWIENDTDWMLDRAYSRACRSRLYTTVSPTQDENQRVFWNGMVSFHPSAVYSNQETAPRRYEGLITGVRPWCLTSVHAPFEDDLLFIHSYDVDGINRLYQMVHGTDHDINHEGRRIDIEGWVETRGYDYGQRFSLKRESNRFYSLREFPRDLKIDLFARTETASGWVHYHSQEHRVGDPYKVEDDSSITPLVSRPQTRYQFNPPSPDMSQCSTSGSSFFWAQDRIEFRGPLHMDSFVRVGASVSLDTSTSSEPEHPIRIDYDIREDFTYSIHNGISIK